MFMKHYAPNSYLSLKIPKFTNISLSNKIAIAIKIKKNKTRDDVYETLCPQQLFVPQDTQFQISVYPTKLQCKFFEESKYMVKPSIVLHVFFCNLLTLLYQLTKFQVCSLNFY